MAETIKELKTQLKVMAELQAEKSAKALALQDELNKSKTREAHAQERIQSLSLMVSLEREGKRQILLAMQVINGQVPPLEIAAPDMTKRNQESSRHV